MTHFEDAYYMKFADVQGASLFKHLNTMLWYLFLRNASTIDEAKEKMSSNYFGNAQGDYFIKPTKLSKNDIESGDIAKDLNSTISMFIKQTTGVGVEFLLKANGKFYIHTEQSSLINGDIEKIIACYFPYLLPTSKSTKDIDSMITRIINDRSVFFNEMEQLIVKEENRLGISELVQESRFEKYCSGRLEKVRKQAEERIAILNVEIQNKMTEIASFISKKKDAELLYNSISVYNESKELEKMGRYFGQRKNIVVNKVTEDVITYTVHDTIDFWNADSAVKVVESEQIPDEMVRFCMKKILVEGIGKIHSYATFEFREFASINPTHEVGWTVGYETPHPHLTKFRCLGENDSEILTYLNSGRWDMAIEQTIAAVKNINLGDGIVMNWFWNFLATHKNRKCISYNDSFYSINEFYKELINNG